MSLWIDTNKVVAVLLADGWHEVDGNTFDIDAYEYCESRKPDPLNPKEPERIWCSYDGPSEVTSGFQFTDKVTGQAIYGPMRSLLAVRCRSHYDFDEEDEPQV